MTCKSESRENQSYPKPKTIPRQRHMTCTESGEEELEHNFLDELFRAIPMAIGGAIAIVGGLCAQWATHLSRGTRQYARVLEGWVKAIGLDASAMVRIQCGAPRPR